jgi:hypothetical protein
MEALLRPSRSLVPALLATALWLLPRAALACPVCGGGQKPAVGRAYLFGALTMSVIPLLVAVGVAWWMRRRARSLAAPAPARVPAASRS